MDVVLATPLLFFLWWMKVPPPAFQGLGVEGVVGVM